MLRSRTARFATLGLALITPVIAVTASPGFASGESATAVLTAPVTGTSSTFTWSYTFDQNGGNGLSNLAVGFCPDILADVVSASPSATIFNSGDVEGGHTDFGPGIKFAVTAVTGVFSVTFAHPHAISSDGLRLQSHSGDGQTGDITTLAAGPGPCPVEETTTSSTTSSTSTSTTSSTSTSTTSSTSTSTTSSTTTTTIGGGGTKLTGDGSPSGESSTTTTTLGDPGTTTTSTTGGGQEPLTITDDPSPTTTTTTGAPAGEVDATTPTTGIQTSVLGETVVKGADPGVVAAPGSLARTGAGHLMFLVTLALGLVAAGAALMSAFRRPRHPSASSPS